MKNQFERTANQMIFLAVSMAVSAILMAATPADAGNKPLKVFILVGQSNMQEPANWQTLKGLADSPETKPLYDKLVDENGKVRIHKDVYVTFPPSGLDEEGNNITAPVPGGPLPRGFGGLVLGKDNISANYGPELGFGVTMYEKLQEPILIIKAAWGGKSLHGDFRPPTDVLWTPPKGHPDHPDSATKRPLPTSFELPADFQPPTVRGKNIQVGTAWDIGKVNGVQAVYVIAGHEKKGGLTSIPLQKGDIILGLNGEGLDDDPIRQWRDLWFNKVRENDWKLKITRWRSSPEGKGKGTIETFEIDTALTLKDGRDDIAEYLAEKEASQKALLKGGEYYWKMIKLVQDVLKDPGKYHPAYDTAQGYEIAGFAWLQGYNDVIASTVYPNGSKPRGYEQYSWLLAHLIRNVRKELKTPELPFVIGVFGQGGKAGKPVTFCEAMAAPASYEEFKGTVAAVETAEFWDDRILEIQGKLDRVMQYKGGDKNHPYAKLQAEIAAYKKTMGNPDDLKGKAQGALNKKIQAEIINIVRTPEETAYLQNNISNKGFHYFGSPKFFVRTGAAFAEALSGITRKNKE